MLGSSTAEIALDATLQDDNLDSRLLRCRKTIVAVEGEELKATHRLCQSLRRVINSVADHSKATAAQKEQSADLYARVRKVDPRRQSNAIKKGQGDGPDLLATCSHGDTEALDAGTSSADHWDSLPPLPTSEAMRLVDIERPYEAYVGGFWALRPGADTKAMLRAVFENRPINVETLTKLYRHLRGNGDAGGICLGGGPLLSEVKRILQEQDALPPEPRRYSVLEELQLQGRLQ